MVPITNLDFESARLELLKEATLKKMTEVGLIPPSPDVSKGLLFLVSSNNVALSKYLYSKPIKFVESLKVRSPPSAAHRPHATTTTTTTHLLPLPCFPRNT